MGGERPRGICYQIGTPKHRGTGGTKMVGLGREVGDLSRTFEDAISMDGTLGKKKSWDPLFMS